MQPWLRVEFALDVPYQTLHGIVRYQLTAKLKRPRPSHAKKTSRPRRTLSNNVPAAWAPSRPEAVRAPEHPVRVFGHDASRLGRRLPLRRRITGYDVKPLQIGEPL